MINKNKFHKDCTTCIYFCKENLGCLLFEKSEVIYCCKYYKSNYSSKDKKSLDYLIFCISNFFHENF